MSAKITVDGNSLGIMAMSLEEKRARFAAMTLEEKRAHVAFLEQQRRQRQDCVKHLVAAVAIGA